MSGIFKSVKKVFNKLKESKIVKAVVIAAAIWFTAGAAMAYFAAPAAGLGGAMSASASSMWATSTTGSFVSASQVATTNAAMAASGTQTAMLAAQTAEFGAEGVALTDAALASGGTVTAAGVDTAVAAGVDSTSSLAMTEGTGVVNSVAAGNTVPGYNAPAPGGTGGAAQGNFFSRNPMTTMVLGQAGVGAYQSYEQRRMEDDQREEDARIRQERGLMGVDYQGDYKGIVNSQAVTPQQTVEQATAPPVVAAQQVAPVNRPVARKNLPQLNKQGLVAPQQV